MCHTFPISQRRRLSRRRAAPSPPTRGPRGRRPQRARRAFRPVPSCPASPRQTSPSPRRAAPASATACATTLTPTLPPPRRVRSTYACKATGTRKPYTHPHPPGLSCVTQPTLQRCRKVLRDAEKCFAFLFPCCAPVRQRATLISTFANGLCSVQAISISNLNNQHT